MKPSEFKDALNKAAGVLAPNDAVQLRMLAALFASSPSKTVAATMTRLRSARAGLTLETGPWTIGDLLKGVAPLQEFLKEYGKPAFTKDLQAVTTFLQEFPSAGVARFVHVVTAALNQPTRPTPTLKEDVVLHHLRRLEQTLGDDAAFTVAYNELDCDPAVGRLEIAELAKRFTETTAKSRVSALKKIRSSHQALMTFDAKTSPRGGRSAAKRSRQADQATSERCREAGAPGTRCHTSGAFDLQRCIVSLCQEAAFVKEPRERRRRELGLSADLLKLPFKLASPTLAQLRRGPL
jgi:hypothetical protein